MVVSPPSRAYWAGCSYGCGRPGLGGENDLVRGGVVGQGIEGLAVVVEAEAVSDDARRSGPGRCATRRSPRRTR